MPNSPSQADAGPLDHGFIIADPRDSYRRLLENSPRLFSANEVIVELLRVLSPERGQIYRPRHRLLRILLTCAGSCRIPLD